MLRAALIAITAVAVLVAAACLLFGLVVPGIAVLLVWSSVALLALLFERFRYKAPLATPPGPPWQATGEKFMDPDSGAALSVYFNPATGQRVYVAGPAPAETISQP